MRRTWNKLRTVFNNQNKSVQRAGRNSNKKTYNAEHRTLEKLGLNNKECNQGEQKQVRINLLKIHGNK